MRVATFPNDTPKGLFGYFPEPESYNVVSIIDKIFEHYSLPFSRQMSFPKTKFLSLAQEWKSATAHLSSITDISLHPAYQRIIGMGEMAVPFILQEMSDRPDHWFWALKAITGDNPVLPEHQGRIKLMTKDWLIWGRRKGYIK
jgi:hypothetical protein